MRLAGIDAQLMAMKDLERRGERLCTARATTSLPVPLSPVIATLAREGATFSTRSRTCRICGDWPMKSEFPSCLSRRLRVTISRSASMRWSACATTTRSLAGSIGFSM